MSTRLLTTAFAALLSSTAAGQVQFDYITFDKIELDPTFALQTSTRWGILVNTGSVPISLDDDWERGLWYAESSQQLGAFFYDLLNPFGLDVILMPGEAIGDADPLLLAELLPGETFTSNALIATFQFGVPFPGTDFHIDFMAQIGDQIAKTRTDVELKDLGGAAFWTPVSAKRVSSELSPVSYTNYGAPCGKSGGSFAELYPYGVNFGSGPPWIAYWTNMPQVGNWAFALRTASPVFQPELLLAIDAAPGSFPVLGCSLLLGLTPAFTLIPDTVPFFTGTTGVPIPPNPALVGAQLYFQSAVLSGGLFTTQGIAITFGDVTA